MKKNHQITIILSEHKTTLINDQIKRKLLTLAMNPFMLQRRLLEESYYEFERIIKL